MFREMRDPPFDVFHHGIGWGWRGTMSGDLMPMGIDIGAMIPPRAGRGVRTVRVMRQSRRSTTDMADQYDRYSKDKLIHILRDRDRLPRFGLLWARDLTAHDRSVNDDFVALALAHELLADHRQDGQRRRACKTGGSP